MRPETALHSILCWVFDERDKEAAKGLAVRKLVRLLGSRKFTINDMHFADTYPHPMWEVDVLLNDGIIHRRRRLTKKEMGLR